MKQRKATNNVQSFYMHTLRKHYRTKTRTSTANIMAPNSPNVALINCSLPRIYFWACQGRVCCLAKSGFRVTAKQMSRKNSQLRKRLKSEMVQRKMGSEGEQERNEDPISFSKHVNPIC